MQGYYGPGGEAMRDVFLGSYHPLYPEKTSFHDLMKQGRALRKKAHEAVKPATTITAEDLQTRLDATDAPVIEVHPQYGARIIPDEERKLRDDAAQKRC